MRNLLIALIGSVVLIANPVPGGPLIKNHISADTDWFVHVDHELFKDSRLEQFIRAELLEMGIEEKLDNFAKVVSFHPIDDVKDVTIYGRGSDREKAVVLMRGRFDKKQLEAAVQKNPKYERIQYDGFIIHKFFDPNRSDIEGHNEHIIYGCLYRDDFIVMSAGIPAVKQAINVLKGSAPPAANDIFEDVLLQNKNAFFQVAAVNMPQMTGAQPNAVMLRQTDRLALVMGEYENSVFINVNLKAKSQEAAESIKKLLEGMVAYLSLAGNEQVEMARLAQRIRLTNVQNMVQIRFVSEPELVLQVLKRR